MRCELSSLSTIFELLPDGRVVRASGLLAKPKRIGVYALVNSQGAAARLQRGLWAGPAFVDTACSSQLAGSRTCRNPVTKDPAHPGTDLTLERDGLGLLPSFDSHGEVVLLPAFFFETNSGVNIAVPAVADGELADK